MNDARVFEVLEQINERLGQLIALEAAAATEGLKQSDAVKKLGGLGVDARSISDATGYKLTSVAPVLSRLNAEN
ncbi:MAG TPA: hypothetical protein QF624_01055 [Dehalococcoidia bacterium]|nr:hypothetical protein [Dehalococcoidia bacterium]